MTRQARRGTGFERRNRGRPGCERLEPRALLSTISVTGTGDTIDATDGVVTLREAITAANTNAVSGDAPAGDPGMDTIDFAIPGAGPHTISIPSNLPNITDPVTIDGYSQPGSSKNTLAVGDNASLQIEVEGGPSVSGGLLAIDPGADGSTIQGLVLRGGQSQIVINSDSNVVQGNFLGTDASGSSVPSGTSALDAILIYQGTGNRIGGTDPGRRNVIWNGNGGGGIRLGNSFFLDLLPVNTLIQGNYIGVNAAGTAALSTSGGTGIFIDQARGTTIGGSAAGAGNVISGHNYGIMVQSGTDDLGIGDQNGDLTIRGNKIGTNASGTEAIPNQTNGIAWFDHLLLSTHTPALLTIGGADPGEGNLISGNGDGDLLDGGIRISFVGSTTGNSADVRGNLIGTQADGTSPLPNQGYGIQAETGPGTSVNIGPAPADVAGSSSGAANVIAFNSTAGVAVLPNITNNPSDINNVSILSNSIYANGTLGIAFNNPAFTSPVDNDPKDADTGANGLQNYPVLDSATTSGGSTLVLGSLDSKPEHTYIVQYFAYVPRVDPATGTALPLQSQILLGSQTVVADPSTGHVDLSFSTSAMLPADAFITATATDLATSEFSPSVRAVTSGEPTAPTDLSVSIHPDFTSLSPGSTAGYTVTVRNESETSASNARLVLNLPDNANFQSFSTSDRPSGGVLTVAVGNLPAGAQRTYHLTLSPKAQSAGQSVALSARVSTTAADSDPDNDTDRTSNPVTAPSATHGDLAIQGPVSVHESAGSATVTIVRSGGSSGTIQATFQTSGGTASAGKDYQPVSQTVTFADGETSKTVTIPILNDTFVEGNETVGLLLSDVSGADNSSAQPTSTLTIVDDDPAGPSLPPPASVPAVVQGLTRYGYHRQPTLLVLRFSGPLASASAAGNRSLYSLVWLGRDRRLGTRDDRAMPISSATYDPASHSVVLRPSRLLSLHTRYGLVANVGALADTSGRPVRGNAGGLFATTFGREILAGANPSGPRRHLASAWRARALSLHAGRWTR